MPLKKKLFLTGATGMVGRNILENKRIDSWEVLAPPRSELDLSDSIAVESWINRYRPDAVIHAAGNVGGIQANISHATEFLVTNMDIGRNVVLSAKKIGVPRLLNLGSSCMYPRNATNPLVEGMLLKGELEPTNEAYAIGKIFVTRLCQYLHRESPHLQYKTLIPCNLYGRFDDFSLERSHFIPAIIKKIHKAKIKGSKEVEIWGDGTARREVLYAADLAEATLMSLENIESLPELMNIGVGEDYPITDYYQFIAEIIGWAGTFVFDPTRPVGMARKLVNIDNQEKLGWSPSTSLVDGLKETYRYYKQSVI